MFNALITLSLLSPLFKGSGQMNKQETKSNQISSRQAIHLKYDYQVVGKASWYGKQFDHKLTANGEIYDMQKLTAAHKSLPFDTLVKVTNLRNGESVIVRINDRGPYVRGRQIDLSYGAAKQLGMVATGVTDVKLEILLSKTKFDYQERYSLLKKQ